jgi:glycerate 2-kinase
MNGDPHRTLKAFFTKALEGVDPGRRVAQALARRSLARALAGARRIGVFACGKAAARMVLGAPAGLRRGALVVLPKGYPVRGLSGCEVLFSAHPEPDSSSIRAARRAIAFFEEFGPDDAILCLVSGGTSSLLALPGPGIRLASKRGAVRNLMRSGASIVEINRLRKKLSAVKGGKLGRRTRARLVTLVFSDVPGDDPALVGSGPTIRSGSRDAVEVVGSNRMGLESAARAARDLGLEPRIVSRRLSGEAREQGRLFARQAVRMEEGEVLLAGGETTVTISGRGLPGRGGRNLEFVLGAAIELAGIEGVAVLSAGSDGIDGSSRAAGAVADGSTLARARRRGLDPRTALDRRDTERFFDSLGDLVAPGPTGTNVCDWAFALRPIR